MQALVTGAGGFIGGHLAEALVKNKIWVRGVDLHRPEFDNSKADAFIIGDLRDAAVATEVMRGIDWVFALAADMGGMGHIGNPAKQIEIFWNNIRINMNTLTAAREANVKRLFFASSACVYPNYKQGLRNAIPLKEEDAFPADPQGMYGWEKLMTELLATRFREIFDLDTCFLRFHNTYGPGNAYEGGREKVVGAACRKIARAAMTDNHVVDVWGDGRATRSYLYIDDNIEGILRFMMSAHPGPLNLGRGELVSVNRLYDMIAYIAGIKIVKHHDLTKPEGVRGRNSDNTQLQDILGWEPQIPLYEGLAKTYAWVSERMMNEC